jgi:hypothetical protein
MADQSPVGIFNDIVTCLFILTTFSGRISINDMSDLTAERLLVFFLKLRPNHRTIDQVAGDKRYYTTWCEFLSRFRFLLEPFFRRQARKYGRTAQMNMLLAPVLGKDISAIVGSYSPDDWGEWTSETWFRNSEFFSGVSDFFWQHNERTSFRDLESLGESN